MPVQQYNSEGVSLQAAVFQRRHEANFAFAKAPGAINMIPGIAGSWLMSSRGSTTIPDNTGLGMALTQNGSPAVGNIGIAQYMIFDGNNDYLSRTSEANILPSTNFALGGWFYFSATGARALMAKWTASFGAIYQFRLYKHTDETIHLGISTDGLTETQAVASTETITLNTWYYIAGFYKGSSELAVCVNKNWYSNVTAIPASISAVTPAFTIGAYSGTSPTYFSGRGMLFWLSMRFSDMPRATINTVYENTRALLGV